MKNLERELEQAFADYAAGRISEEEMDERVDKICKKRDKETIKGIRKMRAIERRQDR